MCLTLFTTTAGTTVAIVAVRHLFQKLARFRGTKRDTKALISDMPSNPTACFPHIWPSLRKLGFQRGPQGFLTHPSIDDKFPRYDKLQQYCARYGVPDLGSDKISPEERQDIHWWVSFAYYPEKVTSPVPDDVQAVMAMKRLGFRIRGCRFCPPGGGNDDWFHGLQSIQDYIRGTDEIAMSTPVDSGYATRHEDEKLLRLWAATSPSPLPEFTTRTTQPKRRSIGQMCVCLVASFWLVLLATTAVQENFKAESRSSSGTTSETSTMISSVALYKVDDLEMESTTSQLHKPLHHVHNVNTSTVHLDPQAMLDGDFYHDQLFETAGYLCSMQLKCAITASHH